MCEGSLTDIFLGLFRVENECPGLQAAYKGSDKNIKLKKEILFYI